MWTKMMSGPRKKAPKPIAVIDPDSCFGAFACSICQAACPVANCIVEDDVPEKAMLDAGFTPQEAKTVKPKKGKGCEKCNGSGCKGRAGLYEVMEMDDELRELILVGASALELRRKAIDEGMITLRRSGLMKVMDGVTTIEEVARETVK